MSKLTLLGTQSKIVSQSSVLQDWYDGLSIKPSDALWNDLKTMADGMNEDGDWSEFDFFAMLACMETDEQRLRPLKTSSGDDMENIDAGGGGLLLDNEGCHGNTADYVNTKWNPSDDGVKYTLNSAFLGVYARTTQNINTNKAVVSCEASPNQIDFYVTHVKRTITSTALSSGTTTPLNGGNPIGSTPSYVKSGSAVPYFVTNKRTPSTNFVTLNNLSSNGGTPSIGLSFLDLPICGLNESIDDQGGAVAVGTCNDIVRTVITGSGNVSETRISARLKTFFQSRGLTVYA